MKLIEIKKKIISAFIISNILMFSCVVPVHAEGYYTLIDFVDDTQNYLQNEFNNDVESTLKNYTHKCFQTVGFLIREVQDTLGIKRAINQVDSNIDDNSTDKDVAEWIQNNVSVSGNSVQFNDNMNQFIKNYEDTYVSDHKAYVYSFGMDKNLSIFPSVAKYQSALHIMGETDAERYLNDQKRIYMVQQDYFAYIDLTQYPYLVMKQIDQSAYLQPPVNPWDANTNTWITTYTHAYLWSSTEQTYNEVNTTFANNTARRASFTKNDLKGSNTIVWFNNTSKQYRYFSNRATINPETVLTQPYYYNNDVWSNYDNSTGDYNVTSDNINTVSYGDTISYINSFNNENGYPPSSSDININIENQNDENKNPSGGGGSGGEDNGGGSGGSGGSGSGSDGIFDFLSDLGVVLGNLISNLGQAITNIIRGISDLVTSIVTDLPTVFFDFIGTIFGWLPDEWVTLLSLSLAAMLIWGIVKVIRG